MNELERIGNALVKGLAGAAPPVINYALTYYYGINFPFASVIFPFTVAPLLGFINRRATANCKAFYEALKKGNINKIQATLENKKFDEDFIDTLLMILFESEKPVKATILGNLFNDLSLNKIAPDEYKALSEILIQASIPALNALKTFLRKNSQGYAGGVGGVAEEPLLLSLGVARRVGTRFDVSDLGKALYNYGMS